MKDQEHPLRWGTHRFFARLYTPLDFFFIAYINQHGKRLFERHGLGWKYIRLKMNFNSFKPEMQNCTDQVRKKKRRKSTDIKRKEKEEDAVEIGVRREANGG